MTENIATRITAPARTDAAGAQSLAMQMDAAIRGGSYNIALDMSATVFLSSAGLRVLLMYYQKMKKLGGCLVVETMSTTVRETLQQCDLMALAEPAQAAAAQVSDPDLGGTIRITKPSVEITMERIGEKSPGKCMCFGEPCMEGPRRVEPDLMHECPIAPDMCGVGIGMFGEKSAQAAEQLGEWMCVCGLAMSAPPGSGTPDYMLATDALRPKAQLLYAACFNDAFTEAARFSARMPARDVRLSDLLDAALEWSEPGLIGITLVGETSGLVGASLIKALPAQEHGLDFFAHPAVRSRLAFTPEPEYSEETAVVAGVVSRGAPEKNRGFLRLVDGKREIWAHLHAALFSFCAMPAGRILPGKFIRELAETEKLKAVLHLLNDERPVVGIGESSFRGGALWTTPLHAQESINT